MTLFYGAAGVAGKYDTNVCVPRCRACGMEMEINNEIVVNLGKYKFSFAKIITHFCNREVFNIFALRRTLLLL